MSTSADIILQTEDGYKSIYLHSDGYPSHTYEMLKEHYMDREKVEQMIELGNMSSLDKSIECPEGHSYDNRVEGYSVFYGRDRGETGQEAIENPDLYEHYENSYSYLFTLDGEWKVGP